MLLIDVKFVPERKLYLEHEIDKRLRMDRLINSYTFFSMADIRNVAKKKEL